MKSSCSMKASTGQICSWMWNRFGATTKKLKLIENATGEADLEHGSAIIYFTLIRTLEAFSEQLHQRGLHHVVYHGDLPRDQRRQIQNRFMDGGVPVVLATNAFGMGVDKEDIRLVVHADVPGSMESYYQEIGRAGRDGFAIAMLAAIRRARSDHADEIHPVEQPQRRVLSPRL